MGIRSYIRDRKQVKASRATESGVPNMSYESALDNWGKPDPEHVKKMDEAYETHMRTSREKRSAEEAEKEAKKKADDEAASLRRQRPPKKEHYDDSRMRYLGDD
jgi:hypothetical protein